MRGVLSRRWLGFVGCVAFTWAGALASCVGAEWQPAKGPLMTHWARNVKPGKVHPEYPRPQLVRSRWVNLNGLWQYALAPKADDKPEAFAGEILVPFPIESALSGVMKRVDENTRLWYRRTFKAPAAQPGERTLLHFGAVDWQATVWVNGRQIAEHRGGYDPFSFDITEALKQPSPKPDADHELVVAVWDPTDKGTQPRGKQVQKPGGIFYTPSTGIWQTVWLEVVPATYIAGLKITPDVAHSQVRLAATIAGQPGEAEPSEAKLWAKAFDGDRLVASAEAKLADGALVLDLPKPRLWSPDDPFLYRLKVGIAAPPAAGAAPADDEVESYCGLRSVALGKDPQGITRILLNGQPLFQWGPLDQGFWPDGLYTAPSDDALRYDIEMTRRLGFNMARKHVKVEPDRWYYWCDKLGLLVWQDMPSGDKSIGGKDPDLQRSPESARQFEQELKALIDTHVNHPSIVMWVPFNEGWGQFDTVRISQWIQKYDPTRLVDCASGWVDRPAGDVHDIHSYPGPAATQPEEHRAAVLGEFGGLGLPIHNHTWQDQKNWGYKNFTDAQSLTKNLVERIDRLHPLIGSPGLSAAVYTQTTDVEGEVNGLLTYDRTFVKPEVQKVADASRRLFLPPPVVQSLVATAERQPKEQPVEWRYTTDKPADDWTRADFDDTKWSTGPAGFGKEGTPGARIHTPWTSKDIWLRRAFELTALPSGRTELRMHHDDDVEVYLNGVPAAKLTGYTGDYESVAIEPAALAALRPGKNVIAVHCLQRSGGQYIDAGIDTLPQATESALAARPGEWQSLFDGKTLRGWQSTPFGGHGDVEVQDGKLVLGFGEPLTGVSWTGGELPKTNYEVELDARRVDGADFFCGLTFPLGDDPCSFIVGGWGGGVVGLSSIDGADAADNETTKFRDFEKGRWYHIHLRVTKAKVEAWIDADQVVDVELAGKKISIRREVELSRPLGFATYMTTGALKNLRLRRMAEPEADKPK